jgi:8-oxo-dGTP pyrophosphatase MutT (NUDIX family)
VLFIINYSECEAGTSEAKQRMHPIFYKILKRFGLRTFLRLSRGKTLGVRVAIFDYSGAVMLVKQSYSPGWILPGGGVEKGELLIPSAIREIQEEAGIMAEGPLVLHGIFSNEATFPGDFVCLYILRQFRREAWKPDHEILEAKFFPVAQLPSDITDGSRRRLEEIVNGQPVSEHW